MSIDTLNPYYVTVDLCVTIKRLYISEKPAQCLTGIAAQVVACSTNVEKFKAAAAPKVRLEVVDQFCSRDCTNIFGLG